MTVRLPPATLRDSAYPVARRCPPAGGDPFAVFSGQGARYKDDVRSWVTVEPTDDYTVLTLLAFADMVARQ